MGGAKLCVSEPKCEHVGGCPVSFAVVVVSSGAFYRGVHGGARDAHTCAS